MGFNSDAAYHEMSMVFTELSPSNQLKAMKKENSEWIIKPCPGGYGVQQALESRLKAQIKVLLKENKIKSRDVA